MRKQQVVSSNEMKQKKIGVLMGGLSAEREISLKTGNAILTALKDQGYQAVKIEVDHAIAATLLEERIAVAFIALHGPWGEDGSIQGLLEMMGIPYTGSSVLASALAMHKVMAKKIFCYHNLPTPPFQVVHQGDDHQALALTLPVVVKPVCGGSTIGTTIVQRREDLEEALRCAAEYEPDILIEQFVDGVDITVGVLNGKALPIVEMVPKSGFYDFRSKYTPGQTEYIVPARLSAETTSTAQRMAVAAYQALQCAGAARVDFRLDRAGALNILEVNTIPGLTATSLLPMAAAKAGIDFSTLVAQMLGTARLFITAKDVTNG